MLYEDMGCVLPDNVSHGPKSSSTTNIFVCNAYYAVLWIVAHEYINMLQEFESLAAITLTYFAE